METAVHFHEPVSFLTESTVVEQGQWNRQKIIMQTAVIRVQPLAVSSPKRAEGSFISRRVEDCR